MAPVLFVLFSGVFCVRHLYKCGVVYAIFSNIPSLGVTKVATKLRISKEKTLKIINTRYL